RGKRVDVGRIDLLPLYSLFDVKTADAARVIAGIKGSEFLGKRLYAEVASPDKDYARSSRRRSRKF
ncbi:MAG: DbpA RNA binding domain-containing protein, partial [Bacteroidales bacterium]|nr:DbpA RNA binding domain-containing protein [Bacteroidales bacterium]